MTAPKWLARVDLLESELVLQESRIAAIEAELAAREARAVEEMHSPVPELRQCWCGRKTVYVARSNVALGLTASCGDPECKRPKEG